MTKKIIAVLLVLIMAMSMILVGCGTKEVTEADIDKIATYYFEKKFGDESFTMERSADKVVTAKSAFVVTGTSESGIDYTIAILKDGSGVYSYGIESGKANRLGSCNVG